MYPSYSMATFTGTPLYAQAPVFVPSNTTQVANLQPASFPLQTEPQHIPCSPPAFALSPTQSTQGPARFYAPPPQPVARFGINATCNSSLQSPPQIRPELKPPLVSYTQMANQPHPQQNPQIQPQPHHQPHHQPHPQTGPRLSIQHPSTTGIYYPQSTSPAVTYSSIPKQYGSDKMPKTMQINNAKSTGFGGNLTRQTTLSIADSYHPAVDGCVLPLTEPEKHKLFGQFEEVLSTHGAMEACDNRLLSIFMQLPAPIRRGIKKIGGIKSFLQQAEDRFIVEGENVSLKKDPMESSAEETSFDTAEWEESRTEDFLLMSPEKDHGDLESSEDTTALDDPESAKLLEMCSFFSRFGSGGGYYDDYVALYPGKKPSFVVEDKFSEPVKRKPCTSTHDTSDRLEVVRSDLAISHSQVLQTQQSQSLEQEFDLTGPEEFVLNEVSDTTTKTRSKSLLKGAQRVEDDQEAFQENLTITEALAAEVNNRPRTELADTKTTNSSDQLATGLSEVMYCPQPSFNLFTVCESLLSTVGDTLPETDPESTSLTSVFKDLHVLEELVPHNSVGESIPDTGEEIAHGISFQLCGKDTQVTQDNTESELQPKLVMTETDTESHIKMGDHDPSATNEPHVTTDNESDPSPGNSGLPHDKDIDQNPSCNGPVLDRKETQEELVESSADKDHDTTVSPSDILPAEDSNDISKSIEEGEYEVDGSVSSDSGVRQDRWEEILNEEQQQDIEFPDLKAAQNRETTDQPQKEKPEEVPSVSIPSKSTPSKSKLENAKDKQVDLKIKDVLINKILVKTKDKGINTDEIRTCTRAVCTKKIVLKNQGVTTDCVVTQDRAVETPCELEEAYMEKYLKAIANVKTLEISLDCERNMLASIKNKHTVELRQLRDVLEESNKRLGDSERELEVRRKQQTSELKKTTIELRELQGHYSMVKSKLVAVEKQNSCLSTELESVARELLDMEAASAIAQVIDKVIPKSDAETDTQELDKAREYSDRITADRIVALLDRAKSAELKLLEMQHRSLLQEINSAATDAEYSYNIYAQSPQLSLPERVQLVSKWSEYQNNVQAAISKLESEYSDLIKIIKDQDKALVQLPSLTKPTLEPFTLTAPKHLTSNFSEPQEVFRFSAQPIPKTNHTVPSSMHGPVTSSMGIPMQNRPTRAVGRGRGRRLSNTMSADLRPGEQMTVNTSKSDQVHPLIRPSALPSSLNPDPLPQNQQVLGDTKLSQMGAKEPANQPQTGEALPPGLSCGSRLPSASGDGVKLSKLPNMPANLAETAVPAGEALPSGLSYGSRLPFAGGDVVQLTGPSKATNLSETTAPQEALPQRLSYGSRLPSAGAAGVQLPGLPNKQDAPAAEQPSKQPTAKSRAERIQNMQRRLNSAAALSKLRSTFTEGHHPNTLTARTFGHSARRLNLLKGSNITQQQPGSESGGVSQSQGVPDRHPGEDVFCEDPLSTGSLTHSQDSTQSHSQEAPCPNDVTSHPQIPTMVKHEPSVIERPTTSELPTGPGVSRQNVPESKQTAQSSQSITQLVYQQIEHTVQDQMLHTTSQNIPVSAPSAQSNQSVIQPEYRQMQDAIGNQMLHTTRQNIPVSAPSAQTNQSVIQPEYQQMEDVIGNQMLHTRQNIPVSAPSAQSNQFVIQPEYQQMEDVIGNQILPTAGQQQMSKLPNWQPAYAPHPSQAPQPYPMPLMSFRLNTPQTIPARFNPSYMTPQRMPIINPVGRFQSVPHAVKLKPPPQLAQPSAVITKQQPEQQQQQQERQPQQTQDQNQQQIKDEMLSNNTSAQLPLEPSESRNALSEKSSNPVESIRVDSTNSDSIESHPVPSCANEDQLDSNKITKDDSTNPLKSPSDNPSGGVGAKISCEDTNQDPTKQDILTDSPSENPSDNPSDIATDIDNLNTLTPAQKISMEWKVRTLNQSAHQSESSDMPKIPPETTPQPPTPEIMLPSPTENIHSKPGKETTNSGVNFDKLQSSSAWHNPATLPPRFQACHRVHQASKVAYPENQQGPDLKPVQPALVDDEHVKKRKASGQDCDNRQNETPDLKKTEKTEEKELGGEEWQTQMSKRKKKALAQQQSAETKVQQRTDMKQQQQPQTKPKKTGSMDKLMGVLSQQFTDVKPKEVMEVIKRVRQDHNGSLSGVPISTIIEGARRYLKTTLEASSAKGSESAHSRTSVPPQSAQTGPRELPTLQAIQQIVPDQENTDLCVICQEDMDSQTGDIRMLDCGHLFHDQCISVWYNTRERTCPICRCHTLFAEDFPRLQ